MESIKVFITVSCLLMVMLYGVQARSWRVVRQVIQERPEEPVTEGNQVFTESVVDGAGALLNCPCPAPSQFNPVCGSDRVTYGNQQKLECARMCGRSVELAFVGVCG